MPIERSVSIIGLGLMGSALARKCLETGWRTTVWNRSSAKVHSLVAEGALPTASVTECIGASDLVIVCLLNAQAVNDVLGDVDAHCCTGRTLVNYTSGTQSQARVTHELAKRLSFSACLQGVILASPDLLGLPESPIYYAGDERAFTSIQDEFKVFGRSVYLGDDPASASVIGCIVMDSFFGLTLGFLQSVTVLKSSKLYQTGGAERLLSEELVPFLSHGVLALLGDYAKQIDSRDYIRDDGKGMPLSLLAETLESMNEVHSNQGVSCEPFGPLLSLMKARISEGGAAEELSSLVEVIRGPGKL